MDGESAQSIRVLECLAACNEQLIALCQWLPSMPGIRTVSHGFSCRAYKSGTSLEAYVEADLEDEKVICWWIEVGWNREEWRIEPSVLVNDDQGQRVLRDFPEKRPKTIDDFTVELKEATSDLVAYARSMDLSPLVFDTAEVSHQ
jgi:hypothetical protein